MPREEPRAVPAHSVLGPCRGLGVDTCVTRALVIHRGGMRSPKGEIRQRWWVGGGPGHDRPGPTGEVEVVRVLCS